MLLLFVPCLYCNVSDAWILPGRWPRIAVAAAGMYVELLLAAIATWIWWFVEPGLVSNLCLGIMLIGSVNTLVLNGNPLLRYDGYFILSHALELPNLQEKSNSLLAAQASRLGLGVEPVESRFWPERGRRWLVAYAIVSLAYRAGLLVAVSWMLYDYFKSSDLEIIGQVFAWVAVAGFVLSFRWPAGCWACCTRAGAARTRFPSPPGNRRRAAALVALAMVFSIPLPNHVPVPLVLALPPATLRESPTSRHPACSRRGLAFTPAAAFAEGHTLAKLQQPRTSMTSWPDSAATWPRAGCWCARWSGKLARPSRVRWRRDSGCTRETLAGLERRLMRLEEEQRRLTLRSPVDGEILPPPPHCSPSSWPTDCPVGWVCRSIPRTAAVSWSIKRCSAWSAMRAA